MSRGDIYCRRIIEKLSIILSYHTLNLDLMTSFFFLPSCANWRIFKTFIGFCKQIRFYRSLRHSSFFYFRCSFMQFSIHTYTNLATYSRVCNYIPCTYQSSSNNIGVLKIFADILFTSNLFRFDSFRNLMCTLLYLQTFFRPHNFKTSKLERTLNNFGCPVVFEKKIDLWKEE